MGNGRVSTHPWGTALFLAAGLLVGYAYCYQGGGWNQNSRFALVRAIVERGTVQIDDTGRWQGQLVTGDLARRGTHLYSDKAPGLALTAVPVVAVARLLTPASKAGLAALSYVATVATASVPTGLAALLLFWLALQLGTSADGAAFAANVSPLGKAAELLDRGGPSRLGDPCAPQLSQARFWLQLYPYADALQAVHIECIDGCPAPRCETEDAPRAVCGTARDHASTVCSAPRGAIGGSYRPC